MSSPGHGLLKRTEPLAQELGRLGLDADAIAILNPVVGILQYRRLAAAKSAIRPRVAALLGEATGAIGGTVDGAPGAMAGFFQAQSLGEALAATLQLQNQWQRFSGTLDRKAAFLVAALSIYISCVSLVATVCFGALTLP